MRRLWVLCAAAVLAAACLVAAGCSDDSSDSSGTATSTAARTATTPAAPTIDTGDLRRLPKAPAASGSPPSSESTGRAAFLRTVFDDAEALWRRELEDAGLTYRPARLTIFSHRVNTACGPGGVDTGPFYCPASFGVYLDPAFFAALSRRVGVDIGDFAQAYVVAHEVGHHVQTLIGITHQRAVADRNDPGGVNGRSVRFELQADCLAGVWMHSVYQRGRLSDADIEETLTAAAVVGDDFQRNARGEHRPPEQWTHGSSAQRQRWLTAGLEEGTPAACDTFSGAV